MMPRISYSRRMVGSKVWLKSSSSQAVGKLVQQQIARGVRLVHLAVRAAPIGMDHRDQPLVRLEEYGPGGLLPQGEQLACPENGLTARRFRGEVLPRPFSQRPAAAERDDRGDEEEAKDHATDLPAEGRFSRLTGNLSRLSTLFFENLIGPV